MRVRENSSKNKFSPESLEVMKQILHASNKHDLVERVVAFLKLGEWDGKTYLGYYFDGPYLLTSDKSFLLIRDLLDKGKSGTFSVDRVEYSAQFVRARYELDVGNDEPTFIPPYVHFSEV